VTEQERIYYAIKELQRATGISITQAADRILPPLADPPPAKIRVGFPPAALRAVPEYRRTA
jgi:hypothetical protein